MSKPTEDQLLTEILSRNNIKTSEMLPASAFERDRDGEFVIGVPDNGNLGFIHCVKIKGKMFVSPVMYDLLKSCLHAGYNAENIGDALDEINRLKAEVERIRNGKI